MNKKSAFIVKILLGLYLAYIGVQLILDVTAERPSNQAFMCAMAVLFIIIGIGYAIQNIKKILPPREKDGKGERKKSQEEEKTVYKRPITDKTKYRTAPMPELKDLELAAAPSEEKSGVRSEEEAPSGEEETACSEEEAASGTGEVSLELEDEADYEEK